MITLRKLSWSNVFSYGPDNELILDDSTVTQIIGANGMGKSSIPLIIEEVLFNKNSKGIKKADIPNRYIKDGYSIDLIFTKDDDTYEVSVSRKAMIKIRLSKNGEDVSSHTATDTYKTIQEIIGVDFKTFSQLVYQSTNASLQFLTATDVNRKKFLIDLLHLENYIKFFEIFKEASKLSNIRTAKVLSAIEVVEKWLKDNKLTDTTILPMLNLEINTGIEEKELSQVTIEIQNISEKNKTIIKNNQYRNLLNSINLKDNNSIKAMEILSYDTLQTDLGGSQRTIAGSQRTLAKLEGLGDICPTCEQTVDTQWKTEYITHTKDDIEREINFQEKLNEQIRAIKENNKLFQRKQSVQQDWESLYRSVDSSLPADTVDKVELESRLHRVQMELRDRKSSILQITKTNEERTKNNTRIQIIQEQSEGFEQKLKESQKLLTVEGQQSSSLEILKKAFSTNGLITYKIENLVKELEELTNAYLAELSDGRFTLEFVVLKDKLNVQITDNGNIVDILALSSGELARVNTATLIAIRKLMASISKSKINILFLDEVIGVLDEQGREKLVEVLLGEEGLNTYIVSHQWNHPLLAKIEVVKVGNISHIERFED